MTTITASHKVRTHNRPTAFSIVVLGVVLIFLATSWVVVASGRVTPAAPASPTAAVGALESALRSSDAKLVSKLLDPAYGARANQESAASMVQRWGDPNFQFTTISYEPTESSATWAVYGEINGQQPEFRFFVQLQPDSTWKIGLDHGKFE